MKKLQSRKLWVAIASAGFVILTDGLGLDIPSETYWTVASLAIAYILGEAYIDSKK